MNAVAHLPRVCVLIVNHNHGPYLEQCIQSVADQDYDNLHCGGEGAHLNIETLSAGSFVYYPAYQHHTIRNVSERPVTYLMFKWYCAPPEVKSILDTSIARPGRRPDISQPFSFEVLFEGQTSYLSRLQAHVSFLEPGAGYSAHQDPYDVALVLLDGTVEVDGRTLASPGMSFYPAGQLHGIKNIGKEPARYLIFEFESDERDEVEVDARPSASSAASQEMIAIRAISVSHATSELTASKSATARARRPAHMNGVRELYGLRLANGPVAGLSRDAFRWR